MDEGQLQSFQLQKLSLEGKLWIKGENVTILVDKTATRWRNGRKEDDFSC